jgi:hypothetical protein
MRIPFRYFLGIIAIIFVLEILATITLFGQNTPMPTQVSGTNRIEFNTRDYSVTCYFNNIPMYRYTPLINRRFKGTFDGLSASTDGITYFHPALTGGILIADGSEIIYPSDNSLYYGVRYQQYIDSVTLTWSVNRLVNGRLYYLKTFKMSFQIKGKTLIIDILGYDYWNLKGAGVYLGYAESNCNIVPVPYLTLTNLLYTSNPSCFASMFFDWERTNCSRLLPITTSLTDSKFAQKAEYFPKTDGNRNEINERIYLTVSQDINEVMPNVVGPVAPLKNKLQDKIIIGYNQPYPQILHHWIENPFYATFIDSVKKIVGEPNVALLIKDWWWSGFGAGNPNVLPANDYNMVGNCVDYSLVFNSGGNSILRSIRDIAYQYGFMFGLHQDYVDMFFTYRPGGNPTYPIVDNSFVSKLSNGNPAAAFLNECTDEFAFSLKPSRVSDVVSTVSTAIYNEYNANCSYLDVGSAINPSGPLDEYISYVDFDASVGSGAGKFLYTLQNYRSVPGIVRDHTNDGPTQGEGKNHFLHAGYFDDFEARIYTAIPNIDDKINYFHGYHAPLFVDFHLNKLRSKSSYHGAGHINEFFGAANWGTFTHSQVITFIATELAYGHGGLVTKNADDGHDHSLDQIALEYKHVLPMQKMLAEAQAKKITYFDQNNVERSASQYISTYPGSFADFNNTNFMSRVRVEYDNGVIVYVNRSKTNWTPPTIGGLLTWYNFHLLVNGRDTMDIGSSLPQGGNVTLPAENGWVCASPFNPVNHNWTGPMQIPGWWGYESQGGGIATADINNNGKPDLVVFHVDNIVSPPGENHAHYRIGWDINENGIVQSWTAPIMIGDNNTWWGAITKGADIALADIDNNGRPDIITFWIDNTQPNNIGCYRIGWNMGVNGTVANWTDVYSPGNTSCWWGSANYAAGVAVTNIDTDTSPDMVVFWIGQYSPSSCENSGFYRIAWNLNTQGIPTHWSDSIRIGNMSTWWGCGTNEGGLAIGDIDGNGQPDLIPFWSCNTDGANTGFYGIGWNLPTNGILTSDKWYSPCMIGQTFGNPTDQGAGITVVNLNGGKSDFIAFNLANPDAYDNYGYYRVGFDINLQPPGIPKKAHENSDLNIPNTFALYQNYPNPFNPTTTIKYDLPIDSKVSLRLYDILGREVQTLVNEFVSAGYHEVVLNANNLSTGVYFYRIEAGNYINTKKFILLK